MSISLRNKKQKKTKLCCMIYAEFNNSLMENHSYGEDSFINTKSSSSAHHESIAVTKTDGTSFSGRLCTLSDYLMNAIENLFVFCYSTIYKNRL